jgi:putative Mn2+ efflux pump MntP
MVAALLIVAASLGLSNLAAAVVFGVGSSGMSLAGLEFGARIGVRAGGEAARIIGGAVVAGVGLAIGLGAPG